ncbi:MAG: vitamin K epoxide reductase family protein [Candidatus Andersenbacteria bacterium]
MRKLLFLIAIAGLLVSGYLFVAYTTGGPIRCGAHGGCEIVRASAYASIGGIPTPFYGIVFYFLLAVGALLLQGRYAAETNVLLHIHTGIGLLTSAWLSYLEAFVIEAWCRWCVVSALLSLIAFIVVWFKLPRYDR